MKKPKPKSPLPARLRRGTARLRHCSLPKKRCWECGISRTIHRKGRCSFHSSPWSTKKFVINIAGKPKGCSYIDKLGNPVIEYKYPYETRGVCIRQRHYGIGSGGISAERTGVMKEMRVYGAE